MRLLPKEKWKRETEKVEKGVEVTTRALQWEGDFNRNLNWKMGKGRELGGNSLGTAQGGGIEGPPAENNLLLRMVEGPIEEVF